MALVPAFPGGLSPVGAAAYPVSAAILGYFANRYRNDPSKFADDAGRVGSIVGSGRRAIEYFNGNSTVATSLPVMQGSSSFAPRAGLSAAYYFPFARSRGRRRRYRFTRGRLRRFYRLRRRGLTAGGYFVRNSYF